LRDRWPWLDHVLRAATQYQTHHGDHYAGAITYFSVLALVPLLMIAFSVLGFVLAGTPGLIVSVQSKIAQNVPGPLGQTVNDVVGQAIESRSTVGILGSLIALYSGLGWMGNLREALTAQWDQAPRVRSFLRMKLGDLLALIGLGLALAASFAITGGGTAFSSDVLRWAGLDGSLVATVVLRVLAVALSLGGSWLVFLWTIARLPREPVSWRSAVRAAAIGAVGFEILKLVFTFYLHSLGSSPTGAAFGPLLGLLVFAFFVSRFVLFVTAWAATARENQQRAPVLAPSSAVIRPTVDVRPLPTGRAAAGLLGVGAAVGLVLGLFGRRR
jgi:membrane protein